LLPAGPDSSDPAGYRVLHADRTVRWVSDRGCPVFNEEGWLESIEGFLNDITEDKRMQQAFDESRARYRSLVADLQEVVFQTDAAGTCTFLNPAWREVTGYAPAESLGTPLFQYLHPDDRPQGFALLQSLIQGHESTGRAEVRLRSKANGDRWVEARVRASRGPEGEVAGISGTFIDITDGRRSEESLRESNARFQLVARATTDVIWDWDIRRETVWSNENFDLSIGDDSFPLPPRCPHRPGTASLLRLL
jgi:PAS domain S-box-containing protein